MPGVWSALLQGALCHDCLANMSLLLTVVTELALSIGAASGKLTAVPPLLPAAFMVSLSLGLHKKAVHAP